jgi:hypothetical protein
MPLTARTIPLFIHLLGLITFFMAIGIVQRTGARMRSAATVEEVRLWLSLARTTRAMFPWAVLFLLLSGLYMTHRTWTFTTPWIVVGMASIVIMGVLGGAVVGRSFGVIGRAATGTGPVTSELAGVVANPTPWVTAAALNGMAISMIWVMVSKGGWAQSIGVVAGLTVIGAVVGSVVIRRPSKKS